MRASLLPYVNASEAGERISAELGGTTARFVRTDVTSEEDGLAAVNAALESFGHLHGLVNCAGIAPVEKVLGRDGPHRLENFARAVGINLIGTFNMVRLAASVIQNEEPDGEGERGVIVNTASIASLRRTGRSSRLLGIERRHRRDDPADRPGTRPLRHPRRLRLRQASSKHR